MEGFLRKDEIALRQIQRKVFQGFSPQLHVTAQSTLIRSGVLCSHTPGSLGWGFGHSQGEGRRERGRRQHLRIPPNVLEDHSLSKDGFMSSIPAIAQDNAFLPIKCFTETYVLWCVGGRGDYVFLLVKDDGGQNFNTAGQSLFSEKGNNRLD